MRATLFSILAGVLAAVPCLGGWVLDGQRDPGGSDAPADTNVYGRCSNAWVAISTIVGPPGRDGINGSNGVPGTVGPAGTTVHSALSNLDYAVCGHTGFEAAGSAAAVSNAAFGQGWVTGSVTNGLASTNWVKAQGYLTNAPGNVVQVFGRTGVVVAAAGDYTAAQVGALATGSVRVVSVTTGAAYASATNAGAVSVTIPTNAPGGSGTLTNIVVNGATGSVASGVASVTVATGIDAPTATNVAQSVNGATGFVPTPITYGTNIVLALTNGNLRTLVLSGPTTFSVPARSTNLVEWVRVDLLAGTNVFTLATNNVTGFGSVTISSNGWTTLYFSGKGTTNTWEVLSQ